ncbi:MAG: WD40/YVTN/BNR-like repeat-containing protein, partial [Longimicrobiales bacterium]
VWVAALGAPWNTNPERGLYKTTDGGENWRLVKFIGDRAGFVDIAIHPQNPDVLFASSWERIRGPWFFRSGGPGSALWKSADGGETWRLVKFISDRAGFVDIAIHPDDPDVLFASSWERIRGPWFFESGGPGSALWKSTDGGETWTEVEGGGFPETNKGRIGLAISLSEPDIMYALVEAEEGDTEGLSDEEAARSGQKGTGLYRSEDGGRTWTWMNEEDSRPFYYSQVRVDPSDPDVVVWSSGPVQLSKDGGETVGATSLGLHVDHHAMWWDPEDPEHFIVGNDGGIGVTWDKGGTFDFINTMPLGQFYAISYDMAIPYNVCGGLQDNGTWCGPSRRADGSIDRHMWATIWGGDGFYTAQDPRDPSVVYAESQRGRMGRVDMDTGVRVRLSSDDWEEATQALRDTIALLTTPAGAPRSEDVAARVERLRAQVSADSARLDLRFNWNTPFFLSPHDPDVFYAGADRVLKSTNRGEDLEPISPDLTYADTTKIRISTETSGGITRDVTGAENHATIVALAESPIRRGLLYAGTDDGRVWLSPDDGGRWVELTGRFPGVPHGTWVSRIEPSHHDADRFYVTFDGHRSGDYTPYVFVTEDGGESFRSIAADLPRGKPDFVHVVREDPVNPDLLFVGTDVGAYVSTDRGSSWRRFMEGMPTVPVHDLRIHPRDAELIAGTHGRSILIVDIAPLQQLPAVRLADAPVLFAPKPALQYGDRPIGGENTGHRTFQGTSVEYGAELTYWVPASAVPAVAADEGTRSGSGGTTASGSRQDDGDGAVRAADPQAEIVILNAVGDTVQTLDGPARAGLHRVYWDLERETEAEPLSPSEQRDSLEAARVLREVADSMVAAGTDRASVDSVLVLYERGEIGTLFGGGGGSGRERDPDEWVARPGERYPWETEEEPAAEEATGEELEDIADDLFDAVEDRGHDIDFRGGDERVAEPGDYTVVLTVGPHELRRTVTVVRAEAYEPPPEDEERLTEQESEHVR